MFLNGQTIYQVTVVIHKNVPFIKTHEIFYYSYHLLNGRGCYKQVFFVNQLSGYLSADPRSHDDSFFQFLFDQC